MIDQSNIFLPAIISGAVGIWLASPRTPSIRRSRTAGRVLAVLGLLLLAWQFARGIDGFDETLLFMVSLALPATAVGTITAEQSRTAIVCFGLMLLTAIALFLLVGAWPMALVVAALSSVTVTAGKFIQAEHDQSWFGIGRETGSWEPMLASAVAAIVAAVLATPAIRAVGDAPPTAHNMVIAGLLLPGIGLLGLISRTSAARMFLSVGVMPVGAIVAAVGWIGPFDKTTGETMLLVAIVSTLVGGMWIAAAMLLIRPENDSGRSPEETPAERMNTRLYALLSAVGFVVLTVFLRISG